jgi:glyoxylase-like metal-dependent hydrolase (beta-lactamase superfamily II)
MTEADAPEISAESLAHRLEAGEPIHVLDIRAPQRLAGGTVDLVSEGRFHNVSGSRVRAVDDPSTLGLPKDAPLAVVCGHGNSSIPVAAHLAARGVNAMSLTGGLAAWMDVVLPRPLEPPAGFDHLIQLDRVGKGSLGYIAVAAGEAIVVDPPRHPDPVLGAVRNAGGEVVAVLDTHAHADFISGGPAMARSLGVPYHLHELDLTYPYDGRRGSVPISPVRDGDLLRVGGASLRVWHTPGHTEGSVSLALGDESILTGDFVFIASVGRPDLGGKTEAWAPILWTSLERARREWPATTRILPGHYASESERTRTRTVEGILGELPAQNAALRLRDRDSFIGWVTDHAGSFPDAYRRIKAVNLGLLTPDEEEVQELEAGRNQCAMG